MGVLTGDSLLSDLRLIEPACVSDNVPVFSTGA